MATLDLHAEVGGHYLAGCEEVGWPTLDLGGDDGTLETH